MRKAIAMPREPRAEMVQKSLIVWWIVQIASVSPTSAVSQPVEVLAFCPFDWTSREVSPRLDQNSESLKAAGAANTAFGKTWRMPGSPGHQLIDKDLSRSTSNSMA